MNQASLFTDPAPSPVTIEAQPAPAGWEDYQISYRGRTIEASTFVVHCDADAWYGGVYLSSEGWKGVGGPVTERAEAVRVIVDELIRLIDSSETP